jgi:hypothetical protein
VPHCTPPAPASTFDRSCVRLPGGEELARSVLRKYAPNLPVVISRSYYAVLCLLPLCFGLISR